MLRALPGLVLALLAACSAPPARDEVATPGDFTSDVTVLAGKGAESRREPWMRQGKIILFSDGTVLGDLGPTVNARTRPGQARVLYQRQVRQMWDLARKLGFASPEQTDFEGNAELLEPADGELLYVLAFSGGGQRWTFVRRCPATQGPDEATTQWVRAMAEAAFLRELPEGVDLPVRYDFGPDPYAWFKKPGA
jgi:hypothetical protein